MPVSLLVLGSLFVYRQCSDGRPEEPWLLCPMIEVCFFLIYLYVGLERIAIGLLHSENLQGQAHAHHNAYQRGNVERT